MATNESRKKPVLTKMEASKILAKTPYMTGFHFYVTFGKYTEKTASSLCEFADILSTIGESSIKFHIQRNDFQKWIRKTIGDTELAAKIDALKYTEDIEELRKLIIAAIYERVNELRKLST